MSRRDVGRLVAAWVRPSQCAALRLAAVLSWLLPKYLVFFSWFDDVHAGAQVIGKVSVCESSLLPAENFVSQRE